MSLESKHTPSPIATETLKSYANKVISIKNHPKIESITFSTINDPRYSLVINYKDGRDSTELLFTTQGEISLLLISKRLEDYGINSENLDLNNLK